MNRNLCHQAVSPDATASWDVYRRLLGYVRPYWKRLALGFVAGALYAGANAGLVWLVRGGFAQVFDPHAASPGAFVMFLLLFPLVGLLRGLFDFGGKYLIKWVGNRVIMDLRNELFAHLTMLPFSFFSRSRTGELMSRTTNDAALIERAVSTVIADIAKQPLTFIAMSITLFVLDWRMALGSVLLLPLCLAPIRRFGRWMRRYARQSQERMANLVSILHETLGGVRIVKAYGMEQYEQQRFARQNYIFFGRKMRAEVARAGLEPIIVFISCVGIVVVMAYTRWIEMPVQQLMAFITAMVMLYEPIKKMSVFHLLIQQSCAAAVRLFEVIDTPNCVIDKPGAVAFSGNVERIAFDGVCFSYGGEAVLRDLSFDVSGGSKIAIVGSSGSGKTTLVNLLPRFADVTAGRILLNGRDLRDYTLRSLRRAIGMVTQETVLFNDTVANNIAYGTEGASDADIAAAARQAYAADFVAALPDGYQTVIGEQGVRLSGGQCQRLAIARAILRNPPIMILDEATSALDTESERYVQAALDYLMKGRTVFVVSHRLSTLSNCNRILVLQNGCLAEQGTHEELMQNGALYRRFHVLQFEAAASNSACVKKEAT